MKKLLIAGTILIAVFLIGKNIFVQNLNSQKAQVSNTAQSITAGTIQGTKFAQGQTITLSLTFKNPYVETSKRLYAEFLNTNKQMYLTKTAVSGNTVTFTTQIPTDLTLGTYELILADTDTVRNLDWFFNGQYVVERAVTPVTPAVPNNTSNTNTTVPTTGTVTTNSSLIIDNVTITGITQTSAKISWRTNRPATSLLEYGINDYRGGQSLPLSKVDNTLATTHQIVLTDLTINKGYRFKITSRDASGVVAVDVSGNNPKDIRDAFTTLDVTSSIVYYNTPTINQFFEDKITNARNLSVTVKPVDTKNKPGLFAVTWSNANEYLCLRLKSRSDANGSFAAFFNDGKNVNYPRTRCGYQSYITELSGNSGTANIQIVNIDREDEAKFDVVATPDVYKKGSNGGWYADRDSYQKIIEKLSVTSVGPKFVSVDKTVAKPGDIVKVYGNEFVDYSKLYVGRGIYISEGIDKMRDLEVDWSVKYLQTTTPILEINPTERWISFKIPQNTFRIGKSKNGGYTSEVVPFKSMKYSIFMLKNGDSKNEYLMINNRKSVKLEIKP